MGINELNALYIQLTTWIQLGSKLGKQVHAVQCYFHGVQKYVYLHTYDNM